MESEARAEFSDLELLQREIDQWRHERQQKGAMPAALWDKATSVARQVGVYQAAQKLRLNYGEDFLTTARRAQLFGQSN